MRFQAHAKFCNVVRVLTYRFQQEVCLCRSQSLFVYAGEETHFSENDALGVVGLHGGQWFVDGLVAQMLLYCLQDVCRSKEDASTEVLVSLNCNEAIAGF